MPHLITARWVCWVLMRSLCVMSALLSVAEALTASCVCCSGNRTTAFLLPVAEAWEKRRFMITQSCTITCRLRKSLRAARLLTGRLLGYLLTNSPVTIPNTPRAAGCLPLSLPLTPLWGGHLSGSAPRYSIAFSRSLASSLSHGPPAEFCSDTNL